MDFPVPAKDIGKAIGVVWKGTSTIQHVSERWRGVTSVGTVTKKDVLCLSLEGIYFFLRRCDKPKALDYQVWIAGTVVPSIKKTGGYSVHRMSQTYAEALRAHTDEVEKRELAEVEERILIENRFSGTTFT